MSETAGARHDTLPAELDSHGYVGPYVFPDTGRRRIAAWCYVVVAVVCLAAGAASGNEGLVGAGAFLGLVAGVYRAAAFRHQVDQTQALVTATRAVGFPLGHASAQLTWRGLRSRPVWRIACYSADDPPSHRGFVDIDAIDGCVLYEHTEANPDAVTEPEPEPAAAGRGADEPWESAKRPEPVRDAPMARLRPAARHRFPASVVTRVAGPSPEDESVPDGADGSQVFFSALDGARDPVGVHWHRVDEFQLFVAGSGTMGRHALRRVSIHYADALVPYGPITPGAHGLTMLTLRARNAQSHWMPATRDALAAAIAADGAARERRNLVVDLADADTGAATVVLMADADGLRVVVHRLPAGEERVVEPTEGVCRFGLVVAGCVAVDHDDPAGPDEVLMGAPASAYVIRADEDATYLELDLPRARPARVART